MPPGEGPRSPTFVQWAREGGRWVISAFGEGRERRPRVLGDEGTGVRMVPDALRGDPLVLPLPADAAYPGGMPWFDDNEPVEVAGYRLTGYGLPRPIGPGEVRRIGAVHGVGVYVETGVVGTTGIVYVAVTPDGLFQPYQGMTGTGCP